MNNPNPFVPQGSLLDQQSKRQSRMKLAVFCVLAVSVTGLMAMLIQGCKRTPPEGAGPDTSSMSSDTNAPSTLPTETTNTVPDMGSNTPPPISSNTPPPVVIPAPMPTPATVPPMVTEAPAAGAEYTVVHGDTLAKIAKKNGVSVRALEAANPNVQPTKLKVGQKLAIPAGGKASVDSAGSMGTSSTETGGEVYVVKSGDTLTKIAKSHGTTVKAIKAANNLSTTQIKVGQKLKIPVKAEAPAAPAPAPVDNTAATPAPVVPPVTVPVPTPTPAPAH